MLLLQQVGSLKNGEVARLTLTYIPANDRVLPTSSQLHLKIKNTAAIPLRAAYLHGPYTLHVASYPASWDPNQKLEAPRRDGVPQYEPNLKAGGSWTAKLRVPEDIREPGDSLTHPDRQPLEPRSVTWYIEISSQIIFSDTASVGYEVLLGRDQKSLGMHVPVVAANRANPTGQLNDQRQNHRRQAPCPGHPTGVFSDAIHLTIDDTESLWNTPRLPESGQGQKDSRLQQEMAGRLPEEGESTDEDKKRAGHKSEKAATPKKGNTKEVLTAANKKKPRIHLVILTHGLHSNLGADMLYLKESIDAASKQSRLDTIMRKAKAKSSDTDHQKSAETGQKSALDGENVKDEDLDQVIVRGFSGNAIRTERGIKYLGKRLAHYVLSMTYPSQPFLPSKRPLQERYAWHSRHNQSNAPKLIHKGSHVVTEAIDAEDIPYKITSISFIGHSLGGLIQTYAIAYIQKHAPRFFDQIRPINFIALATPFLGLSNENPMYVKFALDFGLVGRTGQDLGLTWRAPNIARSGWAAIVGGLGEHPKTHDGHDPRAKPLLRVLPTGPAHLALKRFRNRTVYANVVNDGIVPTRTSALLFLDWRGLDRVEKARREFGLVGTAMEWGWSELTGASSHRKRSTDWLDGASSEESGSDSSPEDKTGSTVPQPADSGKDYDSLSIRPENDDPHETPSSRSQTPASPFAAFANFLGMFKLHGDTDKALTKKQAMLHSRSQTLQASTLSKPTTKGKTPSNAEPSGPPPSATTGVSEMDTSGNVLSPPSTSIFESASYLINPPLPETHFLIDPSIRPRTIFHDRVYHPGDIPPIEVEQGVDHTLTSPTSKAEERLEPDTQSQHKTSHESQRPGSQRPGSKGGLPTVQVEERIARAYHRDMSWRKVLVRLEPDAHNNIIVRRKFANAYGWPVVKHLVDTHFADTVAAVTADADETRRDRAGSLNKGVRADGTEVKEAQAGGTGDGAAARTSGAAAGHSARADNIDESMAERRAARLKAHDSWDSAAGWSDTYFEDEEDDSDDQGESDHGAGVGNMGSYMGLPPRLKEMPTDTNQCLAGTIEEEEPLEVDDTPPRASK